MTTGWVIGSTLVVLVLASLAGTRWPRLWLAGMVAGGSAFVGVGLAALAGGDVWEWLGGVAVGGQTIHLRFDAVSALFLVLVGVVGAVGAVYARGYWADATHPDSAARGRLWWGLMVASMGLLLVCANGLHFLMAWEAFALSAYFLITLDRGCEDVRSAGWLYLGASHAGTLALLAFFSLLAVRTGSWDLGDFKQAGVALEKIAPLFWLALFGFGVKAGLMPLHFWLPSAHANAPSHVSAVMSGVAIKMGVYGIVRFSGWLPLPAGAAWVVIAIGAVSALLGMAFAVAQTDIKRLLAYCSVENVGVILIGLGAALLGVMHADAAWGRLALAGALLHVWNHGLFKVLLFFGAGSVMHATGTREMSRMGGLWRAMPWTASLFALGAAAVPALPPLNGFVSEWLVYLGLFSSAAAHEAVGAATIPAAIALALTGALAVVAFVKVTTVVFFGAPRSKVVEHAHECGWWMRAPMIALAGGCVLVAMTPTLVWRLIDRVVAAWNPAWAGAAVPAPLSVLGWVMPILALVLAVAASVLWGRVRRGGLRRGPTWDCGYAAPTARMQYTGGSFGGIAAGWFGFVLRPQLRLRRPRGPFPERSDHAVSVPDAVLERALAPVGRGVMRASTFVRRLQHGRLQAYILYLVAGLAAIAAIIVLGTTP